MGVVHHLMGLRKLRNLKVAATKSLNLGINIHDCEISEGKLPPKQTKLALAWAEIHKEELLANWELASKGELPFPIEPLK